MPQVSFDELVENVCSGTHLVSFPTDTVPALAARPDRAELIFETKQRSLDKPLILMAAEIDDLWVYVAGSLEEQQIWQQVAERYWPGALTLVLPARDRVPAALNPKDPTTIAVRVPNHAIAQAILAQTGPLATTSVNRSGQPALQTMTEIESQFPQVITLSPEALQISSSSPHLPLSAPPRPLPQPSGVPSTIIRWTEHGWELLRQGVVVLED